MAAQKVSRYIIINRDTLNRIKSCQRDFIFYRQRMTITFVNSGRPSSGCRGCFPLSAATTPGLRPGVALPPTSPLSLVCPRRRGGSPSGDLSAPPALSLRGCGPKALDRTPSVGRMQEGDFSPLAIPVGDEGEFTHVILLTLSAWSMRNVPTAFRPSDVARVLSGTRLYQAGT